MNIKTMNTVSLVINVIAVILCTVALVLNLLAAKYVWAAVMLVLILLNSFYVRTAYKRIKSFSALYKDMN
jgi:hypothetical protein